jgi:hypothetical protein
MATFHWPLSLDVRQRLHRIADFGLIRWAFNAGQPEAWDRGRDGPLMGWPAPQGFLQDLPRLLHRVGCGPKSWPLRW